jgi:hypothetical protein
MIITSWNFEALENGYFMVGDISLSGLAALCVTGGGVFFLKPWANPNIVASILLDGSYVHPHPRARMQVDVREMRVRGKKRIECIDRPSLQWVIELVNMECVDGLSQPLSKTAIRRDREGGMGGESCRCVCCLSLHVGPACLRRGVKAGVGLLQPLP